METKFKKGDIVYWQELQGEVTDDDSFNPYPLIVRFINNHTDCFTNDGRALKNTPIVLSYTPYTLNGFTQNIVIEKDTLVWVKDLSASIWRQMFYSHFENGTHYCFSDQKTSKEAENTDSWVYLEIENPLLKKLTPKEQKDENKYNVNVPYHLD